MTRGLRNNNPGNLRISADKFLGEIQPSKDRAFKQFKTMAYGYRALFRTLKTYYNKHHLKTVRAWITRYAPPEDKNDTEAYIAFVCKRAGIKPDDTINVDNTDLFIAIVAAISCIENATEPDICDVKTGYSLL